MDSSPGVSRPPSANADDMRSLWRAFREAEEPGAFYAGWLGLQCVWIGGVQRALVLARTAASEALTPVATWPAGEAPGAYLAKAAEKALAEKRALALQLEPQSGGDDASRTCIAQPIEVPLDADAEPCGVVVIDLSPRPPVELEHALRQLSWGAAWLQLATLQEGDASGARGGGDASNQALQIASVPLDHDRFAAASTALVTELADRFDCDRVGWGAVEGGRVRLEALSHSAVFGERANLTRAIEAAMEEALDQECRLVHPPPSADLPDGTGAGALRVTRAHAKLCEAGREGGSEAAACSIPVAHGDRFCGVLTLERPGDRPFEEPEIRVIEAAISLAGPALDAQRREERWLGAKAWDSLREAGERLVGPRHLGLKLGTAAALLLLLLGVFWHADYRVTADALLEASVLQAAVAPFDGFVAEAPARAGDRVTGGDVLARLDDRELRLERSRWASQLEQLVKQYRQSMAERDAAQSRIFSAQMDQARAQLALVEAKLEKTTLRAPFDGVVVTGDLSQDLGVPVQRGELLYEVAPEGAYRLVLSVDERDIDDLAVGQRGEMIFSALPDEPVAFEVVQLTPVSTPEEGRNTFRVEASLVEVPAQLRPDLRPGMQGIGKVEVDRRRLIWIWTHDIVDWLRLALWRWLP
jgi:hypothetical protein